MLDINICTKPKTMNKYILTFAALLISGVASSYVRVGNLLTEHRTSPINIEAKHPRLSWVITSDERYVVQKSYHIIVSSTQERVDADNGDL